MHQRYRQTTDDRQTDGIATAKTRTSRSHVRVKMRYDGYDDDNDNASETFRTAAFMYMYALHVMNGVVVLSGLPNTFHDSVQSARQSVGKSRHTAMLH